MIDDPQTTPAERERIKCIDWLAVPVIVIAVVTLLAVAVLASLI